MWWLVIGRMIRCTCRRSNACATGWTGTACCTWGTSRWARLTSGLFIENEDGHYLCPLSRVQLPTAELEAFLTPVWEGQQALTDIHREMVTEKRVRSAHGYAQTVEVTAGVEDQELSWTGRWLVVRSLKQVRVAKTRLHKQLKAAQTALAALNERGRGKKRCDSVTKFRQVAEEVLVEHKVAGLLHLDFTVHTQERTIRGYRDRPTRTVVEKDVRVAATIDDTAVAEYLQAKEWRVYVTNAPAADLPLAQAVLACRDQYLVERGCGRLKGRPLSVRPMYLHRDDHATGLIRLVSIGFRILTLLEFLVRRRLAQDGAALAGLCAGNPKRSTPRPTAERILEAFEQITLTVIREPPRMIRHLTPLTSLQRCILELLDFSPDIYTQLSTESANLA